jgi:tripartite-type tricarboxylate transporter receptor subunit TctC
MSPKTVLVTVSVTLTMTSAIAADVAQTMQNFPAKPVRLMVPSTAGGQPDTLARLIGPKMSESWGRAVVVDNRPGGGGTLAAGTVAKAAPDGHTLLWAIGNFASSAALQSNLPYDPLKDFAGVSQIGFSTFALVVTPALGVKSVKDLIALAKAQPGKIIFSSPEAGSVSHLSGARFNLAAGIKVVTVAFKGGPEAMIEVLGGRTHYSIGGLLTALPFIKDGKMLALAVLTPQRSPLLRDVPSMAETLPDFKRPDVSTGVLAPAGTPRPILNQINKELARVLDLPDIKERLQAAGFVPAPSTPQEYDTILRGQIEALSKLAQAAGLRAK